MKITLQQATKAELINAIKSVPTFNLVAEIEKSVFWQRQQSLIDRMQKICEELDATQGKKTLEGHKKWFALHEEHERIYKQLRKLQES